MNGIFYFSSTGNSLYLSKRIKSKLGGKIIYIPNYQGDASEFEKIIVVSPIYSFGLPVHTYNFLLNVNSNSKIYVVLNYGGMAGGADVFTYNYAKENNKNILGVFKMLMPENYTLTFSTPSIYNKMILKKSLKKIDDIILKIKQNGVFIPKKAKTNEKIYFTNKSKWHLIANDFSVKENCVKCGKCVENCPANNISFENEEITFKDNCVACLGCYHRCPQKAIVYKHKNKKGRYINPFINENEIGMNF